MPDYNAIIAFFDEYIAHYKNFRDFEYTKLDMINKGEIEKLSNSLSSEQALIMKSNVLESKREKLLEGTVGSNFAEIAENAPAEFSPRLIEQHRELSEIVFKIKEINDAANMIVSERLKKIQRVQNAQRRTAELDVYDGKGAVKHGGLNKAAILKNV